MMQLRLTQYDIDELAQEHETKSEQLEKSYGGVAKIKSINAKHAEENR